MSKPLVIQLQETKETINNCISDVIKNGIPCFLLEPIIAEIHNQVSKSAQIEYVKAKKQQNEQEKKGADPN